MRSLGARKWSFKKAEGFLCPIQSLGQVVGESSTAKGEFHAFITGPDGMGMRDLGILGQAFRINDAGQGVGYSATGEGATHAFITGPNGMGMRDLGTLGAGTFAYGINEAGQVVGESFTVEGARHAFVTGPDGEGMMDLNSLVDLPEGVILAAAIDINNNGH